MKLERIYLPIGFLCFVALSAACGGFAAPTPTAPRATAISIASAPTPALRSPTSTPAAAFAFPKGAVWTYQGLVKWEVKGKAQQKTLSWKMQIIDKIERNDGLVGYVMQGHPLDYAFYDESKKPSDYVYLVKANRVYQVTLISNDLVKRLKDKADTLVDLTTDEQLVYDFPLSQAKKFGPAQFVSNPDGMNSWVVASTKQTTVDSIKGIPPTNSTEYELYYKTNPDRQTVYFVPNIGITRFTYVHNGTLSEVDFKLVEYSTSGAIAADTTTECTLVVSKETTAYTRPSAQSTAFGKLAAGDRQPVTGMTADGWIGFDPGVAQAANVGPFRLRWVLKSDSAKLGGACDKLPVIASLPATACFQMFMEDTPVRSAANATSSAVVTARAEDYAQVVGANDKWLELDLSVGNLKQNKKGWIPRSDANFNGPCDRLPLPKP